MHGTDLNKVERSVCMALISIRLRGPYTYYSHGTDLRGL